MTNVIAGNGEGLDPHIAERLDLLGKETDPSFVKEIVAQFLKELPTTFQRLKDAIRNADARGVEVSAHKLKGAGLNMGANRLAAFFERMEHLARRSEVVEAAAIVGDAEAECNRVQEYLRQFLATP